MSTHFDKRLDQLCERLAMGVLHMGGSLLILVSLLLEYLLEGIHDVVCAIDALLYLFFSVLVEYGFSLSLSLFAAVRRQNRVSSLRSVHSLFFLFLPLLGSLFLFDLLQELLIDAFIV